MKTAPQPTPHVSPAASVKTSGHRHPALARERVDHLIWEIVVQRANALQQFPSDFGDELGRIEHMNASLGAALVFLVRDIYGENAAEDVLEALTRASTPMVVRRELPPVAVVHATVVMGQAKQRLREQVLRDELAAEFAGQQFTCEALKGVVGLVCDYTSPAHARRLVAVALDPLLAVVPADNRVEA